jgi:hypothetical protein
VAGTTTITLPAATDTLVGKATTDTLTNKTLTTPVISTISNTGTLTLPTSTDTLVGRATTDTLTNKTLTTPVISSLSSASATALTLQSAGTTAVTIDTSQNVGIGTSSPSDKLEVTRSSSSNSTGGLSLTNSDASGYGSAVTWRLKLDSVNVVNAGRIYVEAGSATATYMAFQTAIGSTVAERMRINSSGNVGIGTSSPSYKLDVSLASSTSGIVARFNSPSYDELDFYVGSSKAYIGTAGGTPLAFQVNNTERTRIDTDGNWLVGQTSNGFGSSSGVLLGSNGRGLFTASGNSPIAISRISSTGALVDIYYGGSFLGAISTNGSTITYGGTSDYRLKENVAPLTGGLAKVLALKPSTFTWKNTGINDDGFIAHELQEVCPNAVVGEKDAVNEDGSIKPQQIDTSFLVATLTAAIQELKAINDTQAETINALTARVVALESK